MTDRLEAIRAWLRVFAASNPECGDGCGDVTCEVCLPRELLSELDAAEARLAARSSDWFVEQMGEVQRRLQGLLRMAEGQDENDGIQIADKAWLIATVKDVTALVDAFVAAPVVPEARLAACEEDRDVWHREAQARDTALAACEQERDELQQAFDSAHDIANREAAERIKAEQERDVVKGANEAVSRKCERLEARLARAEEALRFYVDRGSRRAIAYFAGEPETDADRLERTKQAYEDAVRELRQESDREQRGGMR